MGELEEQDSDAASSWSESPEEAEPQTTEPNRGPKPKRKRSKVFENAKTFAERTRLLSDRLVHSFLPFKILLMFLGRYPMTSERMEDATRLYHWNWSHFNSIYFMVVTTALFYILIVGGINLFSVFAGVKISHKGPDDNSTFMYEKVLFQRHFVSLIYIGTSIIQCCVASISLIVKREYMTQYFSFWTKAVQTLHMDLARGALKRTFLIAVSYLSVIIFMMLLSIFQIGPSATSGPALIGILMFREYVDPLYRLKSTLVNASISNTTYSYEIIDFDPDTRNGVKFAGGFFLFVIFACSKVYIFVFMHFCQLLKSGFEHWNGRLYALSLKGRAAFDTEKGRQDFVHLFRDHCVLLDLMEGTDRLFAWIMESYFGLQVLSLCFELYFFIRTSTHGDKRYEALSNGGQFFIRPYDWVPGLISLILNCTVLFHMCIVAGNVGNEANAGLTIIRQRSLVGRQTDSELFFTLNMLVSYTGYRKLELTGGGYFYINRELVVGVVSTVLSYFIILYQFQPTLDAKNEGDWREREIFGKFLTKAEGIYPEDHYLSSTTPIPVG